ncbi:MAG: hypothetical protein Gaeavirus23_2 [Gaeavirus sp.]|uniref:FNIP repeat-containing protein n=1 Tax=Gaeavirus sp. TaxID=2487767 RepID=A0A3G5A358_9VIRU|nr:MAG: hypothetical protein Gaeavirus23_2 [Gaeavirus sp.]
MDVNPFKSYYTISNTTFLSPDNFNRSIDDIKFPSNLQSIIFGHNFNKPIDNVIFPPSLHSIAFKGSFNQPIHVLETLSLKFIEFGGCFNQSLKYLPNTIEYMTISPAFNTNTLLEIPYQINDICYIYSEFNFNSNSNSNTIDNLPNCITEIFVADAYRFTRKIMTNLPSSVKKIKLGHNSRMSAERLTKIPYGCTVFDEHDNIIKIE